MINTLIELDKMFTKVDIEFEKCINFIRAFYNQQNQAYINQTIFFLTPSLIYLLDDDIFSFYKSVFIVKKIQAIFMCFSLCAQYNQYYFGLLYIIIFYLKKFLLNISKLKELTRQTMILFS